MSNIVILGTIQEHICREFNDKINQITIISNQQENAKLNMRCREGQSPENKYTYIEALGNTNDYFALIHADVIYLNVYNDIIKETLLYLKTALEMRMKVNAHQSLQLYYDDIDKHDAEVLFKEETTKEFDMWFDAYVVLQKYHKMF